MNITYGMQENIARNILFIDGISRVGKSIFSGIIPSLSRMEHLQFYDFLEHILPALSLGNPELSFTRSLIRTEMNEMAYNIKLARNVNFRYDDQTGVLNYKDPKLYYTRLNRDEGKDVVEELRHTDWHIPIQSHDLLVNLEYLNRLELDYKMIEIFRHPIDVVNSWWQRGWGERFCHDPQAFTLTLSYKNQLLPWYCAGYEEEWLELNPVERCVRLVLSLTYRSIDQYKKAGNTDHIYILTFEDFVTNPDTKIADICSFLNTTTTEHTSKFIYKANCPREINMKNRDSKYTMIKSNINKTLLEQLHQISSEYEDNCYGLLK